MTNALLLSRALRGGSVGLWLLAAINLLGPLLAPETDAGRAWPLFLGFAVIYGTVGLALFEAGGHVRRPGFPTRHRFGFWGLWLTAVLVLGFCGLLLFTILTSLVHHWQLTSRSTEPPPSVWVFACARVSRTPDSLLALVVGGGR